MPPVVIQSSEDLNVFHRCLEAIESPIAASSDHTFTCIGHEIETDESFLRGHGTTVSDGQLRASICGVVERVDRLVSVRPIRSRYVPELGDVVVGRVIEVASTRWIIGLNARQDAAISLSAVNLPGDVQRRRTAEDALAMREIYKEGDLLSAEVQAIYLDGSVFLHTRSTKYGKWLLRGPPGGDPKKVHLALCLSLKKAPKPGEAATQAGPPGDRDKKAFVVERKVREAVVRAANAIRGLAALSLSIHPAAIERVVEASVTGGFEAKDMLGITFLRLVLEQEAARLAEMEP